MTPPRRRSANSIRCLALTLAITMGGAALAAVTTSACKLDPEIEERPVFVYSPRSCPVGQSQAFAAIYAGGDFEPRVERPPTAALFLRDVGTAMADFPSATRSLVVDVSQADVDWRGLAEVPGSGPVNVLVWPGGEACRLTRNVEPRTGVSMGVFGGHVIIAGGREMDGAFVPNTYVGDLSTGIIERLELGLGARRKHATITAFRSGEPSDAPLGALVAGGQNPDASETSGDGALGTAEIYVPNPSAPGGLGDFDRARVELSEPRTQHGAAVLTTGETLLVGGLDQSSRPMRTMEIIDPVTRKSRTNRVALLRFARSRPTVLRLASGEILVAGGFDGSGRPVAALEWFSPDASRESKRPVELVTGKARAFVPLDAGGALAVVVPDALATPDFKTVWVISAEGSVEPGLPIDPTTLAEAHLFRGAAGAPVLWTGLRWMRWQPWFGVFEPIADAPLEGPKVAPAANGDSGLALWLDDRAEAGLYLSGFRFAARSRFGAVPKPLLVDGPRELAPDRLAGFAGSSIAFEAERGLVVGPGASAFLTDVTFADFRLEVDVTAAAPAIVLRQDIGPELEVGGAGCAFGQGARTHLDVVRRGKHVTVTIDRADERTCPVELDPTARVSLGLRGQQGALVSAAKNLVVTRQ